MLFQGRCGVLCLNITRASDGHVDATIFLFFLSRFTQLKRKISGSLGASEVYDGSIKEKYSIFPPPLFVKYLKMRF